MTDQSLATAWDSGVNAIVREILLIPHWYNDERQYGEFDLQPLGPNETSEHGAFMEVMRAIDNVYDRNPWRQK